MMLPYSIGALLSGALLSLALPPECEPKICSLRGLKPY